eukprot:SAG31_NODE_16749_length_697_cov_1.598662_1_plen_22_part_10
MCTYCFFKKNTKDPFVLKKKKK